MPTDFEGQREDEEIILVFRRNCSVMWRGFLVLAIGLALGVAPLFFISHSAFLYGWSVICVVIGLLGFLHAFILWHFSYYLLTNERLRQVKQKGLFRHSVVDLDLRKIMSVSYGVPGLWASVFNYGTILIQTGAGDLTLSKIGKPAKIHSELQNAIHEASDNEGEDEDENEDKI